MFNYLALPLGLLMDCWIQHCPTIGQFDHCLTIGKLGKAQSNHWTLEHLPDQPSDSLTLH